MHEKIASLEKTRQVTAAPGSVSLPSPPPGSSASLVPVSIVVVPAFAVAAQGQWKLLQAGRMVLTNTSMVAAVSGVASIEDGRRVTLVP